MRNDRKLTIRVVHIPLLLLLALPGAPSATWADSSSAHSAGVGIAVAADFIDPGQAARAWLVPSQMHKPIEQAAVLLTRSRNRDSANRWMQYLLSDTARRMIRDAGYRWPPR